MTMARIATSAVAAALLLMTSVIPASAANEGDGDGTSQASESSATATSGNGCSKATGQCSDWSRTTTHEREETTHEQTQRQEHAAQSGQPVAPGASDPGYQLPSTWDKYDRDAAMAEWRRRSPESFGPTSIFGGSSSPTGTPPCGVLVVPYVYTPCEDEATPPGAPAPTVTIEQVISMAMAKISLPDPNMGSAPCTDAGCKGTVGAPVWFWLEGNQWRTYRDSASAGGLTVGVSARPTKVVWTLGDGQSVTCTSAGTPYTSDKGWATSPDCGLPHGYSRAGSYTPTATITYSVTFSGDTSGSTTLTTTSSADVVVGEYQAVASRH